MHRGGDHGGTQDPPVTISAPAVTPRPWNTRVRGLPRVRDPQTPDCADTGSAQTQGITVGRSVAGSGMGGHRDGRAPDATGRTGADGGMLHRRAGGRASTRPAAAGRPIAAPATGR